MYEGEGVHQQDSGPRECGNVTLAQGGYRDEETALLIATQGAVLNPQSLQLAEPQSAVIVGHDRDGTQTVRLPNACTYWHVGGLSQTH